MTDRGELEHPAEVVPGVTVTWDPAHPHRCVDVTVPDDRHDRTADVDTRTWLRLTAVAVLDRQLYLPLDRSLLDAEHSAAQLAAARTLGPADPLREPLVRRALVGARAASRGVVAHLERLAADRRRPPPLVTAAMDRLVRCYASLSAEVREFDDALASVVDAGHRLASSVEGAAVQRGGTVTAPVPAASSQHGVDRIDPRSIPARVLQLGPTCDAAEIAVTPVRGGSAVRVRVDAYSPAPYADRTVDVGVRLVEQRSGSVRGYGLLGRPVSPDRTAPRYVEGVLSLPPSLTASDIRVDVFGLGAGPPPAPAGSDGLRRTRRATLFLSGWRAVVADVRLWGVRAAPAARLREIVGRITDGDRERADAPLWAGGPKRLHLSRLGDLGDRTLTAWLRDGRAPATGAAGDGAGATVVDAVSGPGDLLAAEVVAAHERSRS